MEAPAPAPEAADQVPVAAAAEEEEAENQSLSWSHSRQQAQQSQMIGAAVAGVRLSQSQTDNNPTTCPRLGDVEATSAGAIAPTQAPASAQASSRPLILITDANLAQHKHRFARDTSDDDDESCDDDNDDADENSLSRGLAQRDDNPRTGSSRTTRKRDDRKHRKHWNRNQQQQQQSQASSSTQATQPFNKTAPDDGQQHEDQIHHQQHPQHRQQGQIGKQKHQHQQQQDTCDGSAAPVKIGPDAAAASSDNGAGDRFEEVDGISYRIVAAVTKPQMPLQKGARSVLSNNRQPGAGLRTSSAVECGSSFDTSGERHRQDSTSASASTLKKNDLRRSSSAAPKITIGSGGGTGSGGSGGAQSGKRRQSTALAASQSLRFGSMRRKSSAFVANLFAGAAGSSAQSRSSHELGGAPDDLRPRRMSIYEMTKSPPPETSIEQYLKERRRSSTVSAKFVQQQLEQQSTFEANYCQRQQYFRDLNEKLINQDRRLLNVVANRGQIHRHSVDIAQLPLELAQAKAKQQQQQQANSEVLPEEAEDEAAADAEVDSKQKSAGGKQVIGTRLYKQPLSNTSDQVTADFRADQQQQQRLASTTSGGAGATISQLASISEDNATAQLDDPQDQTPDAVLKQKILLRKFQKIDPTSLSSSPAPDVKIGQRVAYKEYYGNEFGTIRWIGRVPQICADWTVGVEFDNAIGEGDGSLNGRRYFIAKDCFAKFLSLNDVALVDQHVGRPEPGTMISVMSASSRPGQMISIQRVSTVHVQHCFLNAPHRRPVGADILAVNTRLHCQCPNCGPCAHVVKPPRTQRLRTGKNATHMCQFSTYTCCGMQSQEEILCTYTGNKVSSTPPPPSSTQFDDSLPPFYNSWIEGAGYLSQLQAQQSKLMPEEYRLGAGPEDIVKRDGGLGSINSSRRGSGRFCADQMATHKDACDSNVGDVDKAKQRPPSASSSKHNHRKHRHNHHHHHHHHRHHHRSRSQSPIYSNVQDAKQIGSTALARSWCQNQHAPSDLHSPHYINHYPTKNTLHNTRNETSGAEGDGTNNIVKSGDCPPSYKTAISSSSSDKIQERQLTSSPDNYDDDAKNISTQVTCSARDLNDENGIASNSANNNEQQQQQQLGDDEQDARSKSGKFVYRDSIENRYLFPTDDVIDTAFEADLEDLSQARYGRLTHGRSNGTTSLGPTRNIFKGLRALVSCLSANKSNQSDFSERQSENALRFYEHITANNNGVCDNKSQPLMLNDHRAHSPPRSSSDSCCSCGTCDENAPVATKGDHNYQHHHHHYHCQHRQQHPEDDAIASRLPYESQMLGLSSLGADNCSGSNFFGSGFCSTSSPSSATHSDNSKFNFSDRYHQFEASGGGGKCTQGAADGGSEYGAAGYKKAHATRHATTRTTSTTNQVRRQISSSSDCGFSSASQNSVNFQSPIALTHPIHNAQFSVEDEQKRVNQIYQRIVTRLLHLTPTITSDDLAKLRQTLFDTHSNNCCLHGDALADAATQPDRIFNQYHNHHHRQHQYLRNQSMSSQTETDKCDQIIADIIRKSMFNLNIDDSEISNPSAPTIALSNTGFDIGPTIQNNTSQDHQHQQQSSTSSQNQQATRAPSPKSYDYNGTLALEKEQNHDNGTMTTSTTTNNENEQKKAEHTWPESGQVNYPVACTGLHVVCPDTSQSSSPPPSSGQASSSSILAYDDDSMNHNVHNDSVEPAVVQQARQTLSRSTDSQQASSCLVATDDHQLDSLMESKSRRQANSDTTSNAMGDCATTNGKCDSVSSLPKTFELKLTLSICADDERLKACSLNEITSDGQAMNE